MSDITARPGSKRLYVTANFLQCVTPVRSTFPFARYFTWKLKLVPDILWVIVGHTVEENCIGEYFEHAD